MKLYETFQGSTSSSGSVFSMSNTLGYDFTRQVGADLSVPVYFVLPPANNGFAGYATGLGNIAIDGRLSLELPLVDYSPTATITFPTGSTTKGFSTGSVTYDFDNLLEHDFGLLTPFFDVDVGNSLTNGSSRSRRGIQRPYITLGKVAEFMAGPEVHLTDRLTVSADAYYVMPWGAANLVQPDCAARNGWEGREAQPGL
jgi:hypothetical protein